MTKYYYGFAYTFWPPKRHQINGRVIGELYCFPDLDMLRRWLSVDDGYHKVKMGRKQAILVVGRESVDDLRERTALKWESGYEL